MATRVEILLRRGAIAKAFGDNDAVMAFEEQQRLLSEHPDLIATAQAAADAANAGVAAVKLPTYLVQTATATLANERVLSGVNGASVDYATAGLAKINNDPTLNHWSAGGLAATATASDHSIPVDIGGTTYYIRLSTVP